ncbi:hypothetical protein [Actinosynnema sp. NPDC020468]|uniref:hypothetical protein n=1 Tax=Actinosynnema sp. NPDC020468 TaxID=3154488 RepID=UPI0033E166B6
MTALVSLDDLSTGQRRGAVVALADLEPHVLVELAERDDVPADIRVDLVREVPEFLLEQVLRALPWADELFRAAVEKHGATPALVVLCAANGRRADAVGLAGRLRPAMTTTVEYQWEREFGEPLPPEVRSALVRAVLAEPHPPLDLSGMNRWQRDRALDQATAAEGVRRERLWHLVKPDPERWVRHAEDPDHGADLRQVLLDHADGLPDAVLLACLPTVTSEALRRKPNELLTGVRLRQTAEWVRRHPRIRELAPEDLARVAREVVEDGWRASGWKHTGPDWAEITAFAELGSDPEHLAAAVTALGAAKAPDRDLALWHDERARAVAALGANPRVPVDALLAVLPTLDRHALEVLVPHRDPALEQAARDHLDRLRSAAVAREPVIVAVPSDEELATLPDPVAALRGHLRHLRGRAAQRDATCAGLLRSRFTTADVLRELPAVLVLESAEQAAEVARSIARTCGDDLRHWRNLAALKDTPLARKTTFGAWLDALAGS